MKEFNEKSDHLYNLIYELIDKYRIRSIVLEVPEHWDIAGFVARESGSIFKLSFFCGMLSALKFHTGTKMKLVTPSKWKGQMPKDVCHRRLARFYDRPKDKPELYVEGFMKLNHNVVDGIGLGHFGIYGRV